MSEPITTAQIEQAVKDAEAQLVRVRRMTAPMVRLMAGNLRAAMPAPDYWDAQALAKLKRELQDFNITTGAWRE